MNRILHLGPLIREFVRFAVANKVWWIVPLVIVLGLLVLAISLGPAATPFLYSLF